MLYQMIVQTNSYKPAAIALRQGFVLTKFFGCSNTPRKRRTYGILSTHTWLATPQTNGEYLHSGIKIQYSYRSAVEIFLFFFHEKRAAFTVRQPDPKQKYIGSRLKIISPVGEGGLRARATIEVYLFLAKMVRERRAPLTQNRRKKLRFFRKRVVVYLGNGIFQWVR